MSPLDYASEQGFFEVEELIRLFAVDQTEVLNKEKPFCNLELGKS